MKKIFISAILPMVVFLVTCTKEENEIRIAFDVEVSDIKAYSATVTVRHNATNRDAYYGFFVKGTVSDIETEINKYLDDSEESQTQHKNNLHYQRKCVYPVIGLLPSTIYTYIVFGMNEGGERYGESASVVFETPESDLVASVNPDWVITHKGHSVYKNDDWTRISVEVIGEKKEYYFIETFLADVFEQFASIEDCIGYSTAEFLKEIREQNDSEHWFDYSFVATGSINYYRKLSEGDYVSFAIGLDKFNSPTGHYVKTDVYHVDKYPPTPEYADLLGKWLLTDSQQETYTLSFAEQVVNKSLIMTGWGNRYPINVTFDRTDASFSIKNQLIYENQEVEFSNGKIQKGDVSFSGLYKDATGGYKKYSSSVKFVRQSDGTYNVPKLTSVDDSFSPEESGMSMILYSYSDSTNMAFNYRRFPYTMSKIAQ